MNQTEQRSEEQLRAEIESLKRQLASSRSRAPGGPSGRHTDRSSLLLLGASGRGGLLPRATCRGSGASRCWRRRRERKRSALPVVNVERVRALGGTEQPGAAGQHSGGDGSAGAGARHRLHQQAQRRYRRPREGRAGAGRDRSAGTGAADPPGQRRPSTRRNSTVQQAEAALAAGQGQRQSGPRHARPLRNAVQAGRGFHGRTTTPSRRSTRRSRPMCRRWRRRSARRRAMPPRPKPIWRG